LDLTWKQSFLILGRCVTSSRHTTKLSNVLFFRYLCCMLTQYKYNDLYAVHPSRKILPEVLRIPPGALVFLVPFVDGRFDTLKSSFITETQTNYFCFLNFCKKWRFLTIFAPVWSQRRNERLKFWLVTRFVFFRHANV